MTVKELKERLTAIPEECEIDFKIVAYEKKGTVLAQTVEPEATPTIDPTPYPTMIHVFRQRLAEQILLRWLSKTGATRARQDFYINSALEWADNFIRISEGKPEGKQDAKG